MKCFNPDCKIEADRMVGCTEGLRYYTHEEKIEFLEWLNPCCPECAAVLKAFMPKMGYDYVEVLTENALIKVGVRLRSS